jgi:hypothetical protein
LDQGAIFSEIEDSFRPATDAVDLMTLKNVMGADFRDELVQEIEIDLSAQSLRRKSIFVKGFQDAFRGSQHEPGGISPILKDSSDESPGTAG